MRHADVDEEQLWQDVSTVCRTALENFVAMRAKEGEKLKADVMSRLATIEANVGKVEEGSAERVQAYTQKLYTRAADHSAGSEHRRGPHPHRGRHLRR